MAVVATGIEKRVDSVERRVAKRQNVRGDGEIEARRRATCEKELQLVAEVKRGERELRDSDVEREIVQIHTLNDRRMRGACQFQNPGVVQI